MKKIYIVDDDRNIVESLTIILESEGYEVKSQHDESDLVDNIKDFDPDAIILDVMFPEDDSAGFKMAKSIKNDDAIKEVPILMLSAINERGIYAGTFSNRDIDDTFLPVNEFVEKPIKPKVLIQKIKMLLDKQE